MNLDHIKAEIARMRVQIKRQRRDILDLQRTGMPTKSAEELLSGCSRRLTAFGEGNRLIGEACMAEQHTYANGKVIRGVPSYRR